MCIPNIRAHSCDCLHWQECFAHAQKFRCSCIRSGEISNGIGGVFCGSKYSYSIPTAFHTFWSHSKRLRWHFGIVLFSESELTFTFAICYRPSVCRLSVCRLSVTLVRPTQSVQIFGNISMALGTLAIHWHSLKILRRSSQGNPSAGGVKPWFYLITMS